MERRRIHAVALGAFALVASLLGIAQESPTASADDELPAHQAQQKATLPAGFDDTTAIGGISQPVSVAFAPDGTAFVALQTGVIKSFDYVAASGQFEAAATSTDFADLSVQVDNYGDRGMTGITVDPQFPARPYIYVNYTFNADPLTPGTFPAWGTPGQAYDNCGPNDADEATLSPPKRGCPVIDRVSRLTAVRNAVGYVMTGPELVLVQDGCAQFSSHSSGDVAFGPDGKLYASAGDGASFLGQDFGQANLAVPGQPACPGDPVNEGGALRAQDQRTSGPGDPLGIDGTIFRLNPDVALNPATAPPGGWLVAMGQRNPWRFTFRQGKEQLWSVDVGSSNWEEINLLVDAPTTALVNRGWPCYEGTTGQSLPNTAWQALGKQICTDLYAAGAGAVQPPYYSYRTRTGATPITPGESCPVKSSSLSGIAFAPLGTDWPAAYQDALFFSDFLRGCIWRLEKDANGQPDPTKVRLFAQTAGAPVKLTAGPGGDLYYVDYGSFAGDAYVPGSGGVHRIDYVDTTKLTTKLTVKSSPKKVRIKVNGQRHQAPYRADFDVQTTVKLVAPKVVVKNGVRHVFKKWKGVAGKKARKKRKAKLVIGTDDLTVKAIYVRQRRR